MRKLISMIDFVIENENTVKQTESEMSKDLFNLSQYAHFLKQPLNLGMFVPCDEDGNVLRKPIFDELQPMDVMDSFYEEYEQAKERVLFDGFQYSEKGYIYCAFLAFDEECLEDKTIEDLVQYNLTLTK